jgi:propanediol utilization protein
MTAELRIPISTSMRHVHLSQDHVEALFGAGYQLTPKADLSQPGQFACHETVTLVGPKGAMAKVRILGPVRSATQVEISRTDEFSLGIDAPIRASGNIEETPGIKLEGPAGQVELHQGVIQAQRHIHMSPSDAERFGVKDKDWVMVRVGGERGVIFDDVLVRVNAEYRLDMHLDADEANAADLYPGSWGRMIKAPTLVQPEPQD